MKSKASDYKEYLARMAKGLTKFIAILLGAAAFVVVVVNVYFWIIYTISTHGVDQQINQDRYGAPENIGE